MNILNWMNGLGNVYVAKVEDLGRLEIACDSAEEAATYFAEHFFTTNVLEQGTVVEVNDDPYNVQLQNGGLKAWKL